MEYHFTLPFTVTANSAHEARTTAAHVAQAVGGLKLHPDLAGVGAPELHVDRDSAKDS